MWRVYISIYLFVHVFNISLFFYFFISWLACIFNVRQFPGKTLNFSTKFKYHSQVKQFDPKRRGGFQSVCSFWMHQAWWLPILRVPNVQVFPTCTKTSFVLVHLTDLTPDVSPKGCCCGRRWLCWITPVSTCYIWIDDTVIWEKTCTTMQYSSNPVRLYQHHAFHEMFADPRPFSQKCCPIFSSIGQWSLQHVWHILHTIVIP